jgi:branched-chain amino acid transport system substrate-binding protein
MTAGDPEPRPMNRGGFLKLAGVGAGLLAAGPLASAAKAGTSIKVGVMVPTGSSYALMGPSLLDGLRLGFEEAGLRGTPITATLVSREVDGGYAYAGTTARELLDDGADVVVAGVSALVAERLGPLFARRRTPLVVANTGAHVVPTAARSPFVLHNSLLYWQASFAMGRWAARNLGRRAFVATSLHDAGYDSVYAFRRGFESAGGAVVGEGVSHADPASPELAALFAAARESRAGVVYGLYSGDAATEFVRGYAASGGRARLVVGSLAVEDYSLRRIGAAAAGVLSAASWTASAQGKLNRAFKQAFRNEYGRAPDPFAALGYDTALLVVEGMRRALGRGLRMQGLVEALRGASVNGPRGRLVVDAATNTVRGPIAIRRVRRVASGLANVAVTTVPPVRSRPKELSALTSARRSGYVNEYLCA